MRENRFGIIIFLVGILAYSVMAFAYVHNTFTSKDMTKIFYERLLIIEQKIDNIKCKGE